MKRLILVFLTCLMLVVFFFVSIGFTSTTLKCAHVGAVTSPNEPGLKLMAELMSEKTDGEIEIKVYGGGVLGGERDVNEGVQMGSIDITLTTTGVLENFVPTMGILSLPFLFNDSDHFKKFEVSKVAEKLLATCEDYGLKGLGFSTPVFREPLNSKRPINTPEDFKGLKIRLMEVPIHMDTYAAMGASPTPIAYAEVYSSLQLGVVDGCENALSSLMDMKFYEVSKYLSRLPVFSNAFALVMNLDKWNNLSNKQQQDLLDSARKGLDLIDDGYIAKGEEAIKVMEKAGIIINTPSSMDPFIQATKSVYEKNVPNLPPGCQEIIDEIRALAK